MNKTNKTMEKDSMLLPYGIKFKKNTSIQELLSVGEGLMTTKTLGINLSKLTSPFNSGGMNSPNYTDSD